MTNATISKTFNFASDLFGKVAENHEDYLDFEMNAEQFAAIQRFCTGNKIPANYESAIKWATLRSKELGDEAQGYENEGYGYNLPMGYCDYDCSDHGVIYETTSGTMFLVFSDTALGTGVMLPKTRTLGFHHSIIALTMGGIDPEFIEAGLNLWRYEEDHLKQILQERSIAWDAILVPLGFSKQETYEDIQVRVSEVRLAFNVAPATEDDSEYEDYEDD